MGGAVVRVGGAREGGREVELHVHAERRERRQV